jgi:eukaryotic-like serine/threonine-protein kinase
MHAITLATFVEDLRANGLLPADQIDELARFLHSRFNDAGALAKYLVQRGWLTVYQINQLLQGEGKELVLGPYRIQDCLGNGAISQVFRAWHTRKRCTVTLKVLCPHLVSETRAERQFQREIQALSSLNHPNIIAAVDSGEVGGRHYLAMAYLQGNDLAKQLQLSGPLPVALACDCVRQAALGLQHSHEHRLVHRDIKPANLLLTRVPDGGEAPVPNMDGLIQPVDGTCIKILDWGLAHVQRKPTLKPGREESLSSWIHEDMLIGTADYLAPEQARNPRRVDIRADIYSLGCTFYHLLTGQPPFPGNSLPRKLQQHAEVEPPPVQLGPGPHQVLGAILRKMMAKRPEDRYGTPAAVAAALAALCRVSTSPRQAARASG